MQQMNGTRTMMFDVAPAPSHDAAQATLLVELTAAIGTLGSFNGWMPHVEDSELRWT
jgi:hypothetical protein